MKETFKATEIAQDVYWVGAVNAFMYSLIKPGIGQVRTSGVLSPLKTWQLEA
jgi:hypothetical protein